MFSEHPTHHVFCNIYLYFSHSKSDETIIRTIPKCQVSKWSESSNVFFLLWQFPLLLWIFHWFQNFIFQKKQGFSVFLSYIFFFEVSFLLNNHYDQISVKRLEFSVQQIDQFISPFLHVKYIGWLLTYQTHLRYQIYTCEILYRQLFTLHIYQTLHSCITQEQVEGIARKS